MPTARFKQTTLSVDEVRPNPKNPRIDLRPGTPLYEKLRDSIEHFGYLDPIIWNRRTGMIVSGHQRFQVMKDLAEAKGEKFETVDVMEVDMPENQQDSFMVAVNKITGLWDTEKLESLFRELDEEDLRFTGYEDFEIQALLDSDADKPPEEFFGESDDVVEGHAQSFKLTLYYDSEEERDKAYDSFVEEGLNVRK